MKACGLVTLMALLVATLATGAAAPGATGDSCRHTDVVFYTTDTVRLATELAKFKAPCTDYYLSITPTGVGGPRGGPPITAIRNAGPQFHAMAEVRLNVWSAYASTHGWYAAGVEVRRQMRAAGYDATRGDTWALNEVGAPSGTPLGVDVLKDVGTAREDVADFIHGLHDGEDGIQSRGLVFAAEPLHVTVDLTQYEEELESWYADATFWNNMAEHVKFWAQETYADARTWGVADASLAQRAAYLNDYFLHGIRLAQKNRERTAAARSFLADTYTPVGNASFRHDVPNMTTGIGFGYTNVGLPGMLSFIAAQTYALRSTTSDRFGYAVVPRLATPAETTAVEDRVGEAILASAEAAEGACGAGGEWCEGSVADSAFNDAWKTFANTLEGSAVAVDVAADVSVQFAAVTGRGSTWAESSPVGPAPPRHRAFPGGLAYDVQTSALYAGPVEICVGYDPQAYAGYAPRLFRMTSAGWADVTTSTAAAAVCGSADALGSFAVFAGDPTPPVIVPHVSGPLGDGGWYTGDVTVTWSVTDPQSSIATNGCDETRITADTAGTTLTCSATSDGGEASLSVIVKRDATPPTLTCAPTPATLWPPNGKLVPVTVAVSVRDTMSGPAGFVLTDATGAAGDVVGFDIGTPDVAGALRAGRPGTAAERVYELVYSARDGAGNSAPCAATVTVPHDRGN